MRSASSVSSRRVRLGLMALSLAALPAVGADWTEFRGPTHDGISVEQVQPWTSEPKVLWKVPMGEGFGTFAVAGGKAYVFAERGGKEVCVALDASTGKEAWTFAVDKTIYEKSGGNGPRSTPTIDGGHVYLLSTYLKLVCLDAATGKPVWGHDLNTEFGGQSGTSGIKQWGSAASPVVDGDLVFVVGGGPGKALMAFDKKTGKPAWYHGDDKLTHATPTVATIHGVRQVIFFTQSGLVSCDVKTGREAWRFPFPFKTSTAASPIVYEDIVYCSAGYGVGGGACKIVKAGSGFQATELWRTPGKTINHWSTPVCKDGYLYGMYGFKEFATEPLKCIEIATGKEMWSQNGFGQGGLSLVGDKLVCQGDAGQIVMVAADPKEYRELAKVKPLDGKCWNLPVVSDGKLFARSTKEIVCLDISGK